jgi:N utilization substance protein A
MKRALVTVTDDQLSLAIGKKGQNVRLASKLTGWQIDIQSSGESSVPPPTGEAATPTSTLEGIAGVGPALQERLKEQGISTLEQLAQATVAQLTAAKGVGEKTAQRLIDTAQRALHPATSSPEAPAEPDASGESTTKDA